MTVGLRCTKGYTITSTAANHFGTAANQNAQLLRLPAAQLGRCMHGLPAPSDSLPYQIFGYLIH